MTAAFAAPIAAGALDRPFGIRLLPTL